MPTVVARYSSLHKVAHFRVERDSKLKPNDIVLLQTKRGREMGQVRVAAGDHKLGPKESIQGEAIRTPTIEEAQEFTELKKWDFRDLRRTFRGLVKEHKLPMKFEFAEKLLGGEKLVIYFTSEDRVDFRELVKDLSDSIDMRIELHQVGPRDAAKLTGDVGVCGIEICCSSYIISFVPVSMKMAKTQRISLDPAKISGQCGRLKCCLKYEDELYNKLRKTVPMVGQPCKCDGKDCHACGVDILGQHVTLDFGDGHRETFDADKIDFEEGWSDKDIRRYRKERRARIQEEKAARLKEKQDRADRRANKRKDETDRRQAQDAVHPAQRESDKPESSTSEADPTTSNPTES